MATPIETHDLTPAELWQRLGSDNKPLIVDLRNPEETAEWPLAVPPGTEIVAQPYAALLDHDADFVASLPRDRDVVLVCAKGGASAYLAENWRGRGVPARNLAGGVLAFSELYDVKRVPDVTDFTLLQVRRIAKGCLSWVLIADDGQAAVIDPLRHTDNYLDTIAAHNAQLTTILDTHLHADHISGARALREATGATYYLPPGDAGEVTYDFAPVTDGQLITVGNIRIKALHRPGHTTGSTLYLVNDRYLFTGDTLFIRGYGRPDLGGQAETWVHDLHVTLDRMRAEFGDDVIVFPAHYGTDAEANDDGIFAATFASLRASNPGLQPTDRDAFVQATIVDMPPQPANFKDIRQVNMGKVNPTPDEATELEIGPNRCAVNDEHTR